jgi:hypothetical protein
MFYLLFFAKSSLKIKKHPEMRQLIAITEIAAAMTPMIESSLSLSLVSLYITSTPLKSFYFWNFLLLFQHNRKKIRL